MESLVLASSCSASPRLPPLSAARRRRPSSQTLPATAAASGRRGAGRSKLVVVAAAAAAARGSGNGFEGLKTNGFASMSSSTNSLFDGKGEFTTFLCFYIFKCLKKYAMQQAFKSMMTQAPPNTFGSNSPFPFAMPPQAAPAAPSSYPYSQPRKDTSPQSATVDVSATKVEATGTLEEADVAEQPKKKFAFVDVSPEELQQKELQSSLETVDVKSESKQSETMEDTEQKAPTNGTAFKMNEGSASGTTESSNSGPMLSVDTIEKMMEDPAVQKMVYPNNMGGSPDQWDNRMLDHLKNFDLSSPEVRQQFAQVGMTPEEVVSKIMANPEVAVAFQNPKIQTAIMDCSQNPLNIVKYQNDKEVMDVFMKISQIFPQING
uniref:Protein TIC 40, chloroplastic n=1 Tax=Oryza sativa subsp. japonica TaxID=39947 RepID=Q7XQG5_ORYSJ|nr:OJ000114_01.12 [Oryza sativa Japonica Group]